MDYKHMLHLQRQFERLGFDMQQMEIEDDFLGRGNIFQVSLTIPNIDPRIPGDQFSALITGRAFNDELPVIDQIHAAILTATANGKSQIIISESFEQMNGVLPTKDQIFEKLSVDLKLQSIREKFKIDENRSAEQIANENRRKNKI